MSSVPPYLPPLFALLATVVSGICSFGDGIAFLLLWSIFSAFGVIKSDASTYPTAVLYVSLLPLCSLPSLLWAARKEVKASLGYAVALSISTAAFIPLGSNFLLTGSVETLKLIIGAFFCVFAVISLWVAAYSDGKAAAEDAKKGIVRRREGGICSCCSRKTDSSIDEAAEGGKGERVSLLSGATVKSPSYSAAATKRPPLLLPSFRGENTTTIAEDEEVRSFSHESPSGGASGGDLSHGALLSDDDLRALGPGGPSSRAFSTESAPSASISMHLHRLRQQSTESVGTGGPGALSASLVRAGRRGGRASQLFELATKAAKGAAKGASRASRRIAVLDGVPIGLTPTSDPTPLADSATTATADEERQDDTAAFLSFAPAAASATAPARVIVPIKRERSRSLDLGSRANRTATLLGPSAQGGRSSALASDSAAVGIKGAAGSYQSASSASVVAVATDGAQSASSKPPQPQPPGEPSDLIDFCSCPCLYRCCPSFSDRVSACLIPFFPIASMRCSRRATAIVLFFTGFASGIMGGLIGTGGPPQLVAFSSLKLTKEHIRGVKVLATLVSNSLRIALFIAWGQGELFKEKWWVYLSVTVASLVGATIGSWLREYVAGETILKLLYLLLMLSCSELFGVIGKEDPDGKPAPVNVGAIAGFVGGFVVWLLTVWLIYKYPMTVQALTKATKRAFVFLFCCCCKKGS